MSAHASSDDFVHAGGGAGLFLVQLWVLFPGLLPFLGLTLVFVLPLLVPVIALAIVAAPPYAAWRLIARRRAPRRDAARASTARGAGSPARAGAGSQG